MWNIGWGGGPEDWVTCEEVFPNELKMPSLRRKYCPNINDEIDKTRVVYAQKLGAFVFASDNRDEILKDIEYCKKEYKVEFY